MKILFLLTALVLTVVGSARAQELNWWAATAEDVEKAPCKTQSAPSITAMEAALLALPGSGASKTLNGISFKNESPRRLELFSDLHKLDISLRGRPELSFTLSCDKVLCAVKKIYGDTEGVQLLYLLKTFGFNGSHLRTNLASAWRADELNEILQALADYPLHLYPVEYNKRLIHFPRGVRYGFGQDVVANASMEVFDLWNELSAPERQQTFLHELGHTLAYRGKLDTSSEWLRLGGWQENRRTVNGILYRDYVLLDPSKAVSEYGKINPSEDFAESVVAYRFTAPRLKKLHPQKYEFLKKQVFASQEYLSQDQCSSSP
ncbi:hypothetical protein [Bdellovibrio bacteriovorus]|uniref:hypothetical protein n=1 Tax=Bdellovibrio bacteriovorus TaxID=959 RepID=UPI003CFDF425